MTSDRPTRVRSARGEGGQVRDELIVAAERLLEQRGSAAAVTVADIVGSVGVTAPVLYQHFADKDDLFLAVHARRMIDFRDTLRRAGSRTASPLAALDRRGRAYIRYATTRRDAYMALFMTPTGLGMEVFVATVGAEPSAYDDLVANVTACMDAGEIPVRDPDLMARVVWTHVHGLAALLITMPEVAEGVGMAALVDGVMAAIKAALMAG